MQTWVVGQRCFPQQNGNQSQSSTGNQEIDGAILSGPHLLSTGPCPQPHHGYPPGAWCTPTFTLSLSVPGSAGGKDLGGWTMFGQPLVGTTVVLPNPLHLCATCTTESLGLAGKGVGYGAWWCLQAANPGWAHGGKCGTTSDPMRIWGTGNRYTTMAVCADGIDSLVKVSIADYKNSFTACIQIQLGTRAVTLAPPRLLTGTIKYYYAAGAAYAAGAPFGTQSQLTPARDVKVEVLAAGRLLCDKKVLGIVFTDDSGKYSSSPLPKGERDFCVKIEAVTPSSAVFEYSASLRRSAVAGVPLPAGSSDDTFATSALGPYPLAASGDTTFSWKPSSVGEPIDQALDVSNALLTGARWLEAYGVTPRFLSILYPVPSTVVATEFHPKTAVADVNSDDAFDWGVLLHEYGHYVASLIGLLNTTPVARSHHNFWWNMTSYEADKAQGIAIAWDEGFADFFSQMVQKAMDASSLGLAHVGGSPPIYIDLTPGEQLSLRLDVSGTNAKPPSLGEDNESSIARVLWDFYEQPIFAGRAGSVTFVKALVGRLTSDSLRNLPHAVSALLAILHASPWVPDVGIASTDAPIPTGYNEDAAATTYGTILTDQRVAPTITDATVGSGNLITIQWKPSQASFAKDKLNLFLVQFWNSSWSRLLTAQVVTDASPQGGLCPASHTPDLLKLCVQGASSWTPGPVHIVVLGWNTDTPPPGLTVASATPSLLRSGTTPLTGPYLSAPATITIT